MNKKTAAPVRLLLLSLLITLIGLSVVVIANNSNGKFFLFSSLSISFFDYKLQECFPFFGPSFLLLFLFWPFRKGKEEGEKLLKL